VVKRSDLHDSGKRVVVLDAMGLGDMREFLRACSGLRLCGIKLGGTLLLEI
jgi:hypothetical protein